MADSEDNEIGHALVAVAIKGLLFTYLLMLGFGNFGGGAEFWSLLPFGVLLSFYRGNK